MVASSRTRSASTTSTESVSAVLDNFLGDAAAFIAQGILTRERGAKWKKDLQDVLVLEAVKSFQIQLVLPDGSSRGLDYEVSDDGSITGGDGCGGFAAHWIPPGSRVSLVLDWRPGAPNLAKAAQLLKERGWGTGTLLAVMGDPDRAYANNGYGLRRRLIGEWPS